MKAELRNITLAILLFITLAGIVNLFPFDTTLGTIIPENPILHGGIIGGSLTLSLLIIYLSRHEFTMSDLYDILGELFFAGISYMLFGTYI